MDQLLKALIKVSTRKFANTLSLELIQFACSLERQYDETCNLIRELRVYLRSLAL